MKNAAIEIPDPAANTSAVVNVPAKPGFITRLRCASCKITNSDVASRMVVLTVAAGSAVMQRDTVQVAASASNVLFAAYAGGAQTPNHAALAGEYAAVPLTPAEFAEDVTVTFILQATAYQFANVQVVAQYVHRPSAERGLTARSAGGTPGGGGREGGFAGSEQS